MLATLSVVLLTKLSAQELSNHETELVKLFEFLRFADNDKKRDEINTQIINKLKVFIETEDSYDYDFKELKSVGTLRSDDQKLRIYTWNIVNNAGEYHYFGFFQYYVRNEKSYKIYELKDRSDEIQNPEYAILTADNWYGALYYSILQHKNGKQKIYTLLAWDGNSDFSNKKIIETLSFDKQGVPTFGLPILSAENNVTKNRYIFEYAEQVKMLLHYDMRFKMIVWDHLAPPKPELKGQYLFYGPDSSYDGLFFEKGVWKFFSNINITNSDGENPTGKGNKSNTLIPKKKK